jgi:hypothetical protein
LCISKDTINKVNVRGAHSKICFEMENIYQHRCRFVILYILVLGNTVIIADVKNVVKVKIINGEAYGGKRKIHVRYR